MLFEALLRNLGTMFVCVHRAPQSDPTNMLQHADVNLSGVIAGMSVTVCAAGAGALQDAARSTAILFVLGAQKAGTNYLHNALKAHGHTLAPSRTFRNAHGL